MRSDRGRVPEIFGANVRHFRCAGGLSQEELSVRASLHRTEISQLERGLRIARIDTLVRLAAALEVAPEDLLKGLKWSPGAVMRGRFE